MCILQMFDHKYNLSCLPMTKTGLFSHKTLLTKHHFRPQPSIKLLPIVLSEIKVILRFMTLSEQLLFLVVPFPFRHCHEKRTSSKIIFYTVYYWFLLHLSPTSIILEIYYGDFIPRVMVFSRQENAIISLSIC